MIIKHKLIVSDFKDHKLGFVKMLKEFSGEGLKQCKWVADLLPKDDYFNGIDNSMRTDKIEIEAHIQYLEKNSNFDIDIKGDDLIIEFDMNISLTNEMKDQIKEWRFVAQVDGLKRLREDKLKNLLDD